MAALIRKHRLAIVRYPTSDAVDTGIGAYDGVVLDRGHTMAVERLGASQAFRAIELQGDIDEQQMRGITVLHIV